MQHSRPRHLHPPRAGLGAIVEVVRLLVTLATTAAGFLVAKAYVTNSTSVDADVAVVTGALIGAGLGYVGGGVLGRIVKTFIDGAPRLFDRASAPQLYGAAFGAAVGIFIAAVLSVPVVVWSPPQVGWPLGILAVVVLGSIAASVLAARADEILRPAPRTAASTPAPDRRGAFLLDSSAAIDGRALELAKAGLLRGRIQVPEFVLDELQAIADSGDRSRRRRGRRGLDVIDALRSVDAVELEVARDSVPDHQEVDAKLLALSERTGATLVTTDHNLGRAASIRGLVVLNPHALGESMRPTVVTGDRLEIAVERAGSEPGQGVGFLDDGTMVVVEGGAERIGETVHIEVANSLRTSVGRLLFARLES